MFEQHLAIDATRGSFLPLHGHSKLHVSLVGIIILWVRNRKVLIYLQSFICITAKQGFVVSTNAFTMRIATVDMD